jgi:hypothetical protein
MEKEVQVWDLSKAVRLCKLLETPLSVGARKLSINPAGDRFVAASWRKGKRAGIACYDTSGAMLWHRTDLSHTHTVNFSNNSRGGVWCCVDESPAMLLDADTGQTLERITSIRRVFDGPYGNQRLLSEPRRRRTLISADQQFDIPPTSSKVLDAAFSPGQVCLSEVGGPLRCINCETGEEEWRYTKEGWHVIRVWHHPGLDRFYGADFLPERDDLRMVRFDRQGGAEEVCLIKARTAALCQEASVIVTSAGDLFDADNGRKCGELDFGPEGGVGECPHGPP